MQKQILKSNAGNEVSENIYPTKLGFYSRKIIFDQKPDFRYNG